MTARGVPYEWRGRLHVASWSSPPPETTGPGGRTTPPVVRTDPGQPCPTGEVRPAAPARRSFKGVPSGARVGLGLLRCPRSRCADGLQLIGHRVGLEQRDEIHIQCGGALLALAPQKHPDPLPSVTQRTQRGPDITMSRTTQPSIQRTSIANVSPKAVDRPSRR